MRRAEEGRGGKLLFWSYLALGVTLQLLSLLSLAGRLKRTVKRRRRREGRCGREGGGEKDGGQRETCEEEGLMTGGG